MVSANTQHRAQENKSILRQGMTRMAHGKVQGSGATFAGRLAEVPNLTLKHTTCVMSGISHTFSEPLFSNL